MIRYKFKGALTALLLCTTVSSLADDIIVMRNGDLVAANVTEITATEVKYKKASNPNGPTYTVVKSEILAINYENGDKDVFDAPATSSASETNALPIKASPNTEANREAVAQFNRPLPQYTGKDAGKPAEEAIQIFGLTSNSVIADENIELLFEAGNCGGGRHTRQLDPYSVCSLGHYCKIYVKNNSDFPVYVDLANTFINRYGVAEPLYVPAVTTSYQGSSNGGAVNMGALTGGVLGGVTMVGGTSSSTATTEIAQRYIIVPPHSKVALPEMRMQFSDRQVTEASEREEMMMKIWDNFPDPGVTQSRMKGYLSTKLDETNDILVRNKINFPADKPLQRGEVIEYTEDMLKYRLGFTVAYSKSEDGRNLTTLDLQFYPQYLIGVSIGGKWKNFLKKNPQFNDLLGFFWWDLESNPKQPTYPMPH